MARHAPVSKLAGAILEILAHEGYIDGFTHEGEGVQQAYRIRLKYGKRRERTITGLRRVSKPGRRVYVGSDDIPKVLDGMGIAILSTSRGLLTDRESRKQTVGGEVVCYVW